MKTLTISRSVLVLAGVIVFSLVLLVLVQCQRATGATPEPNVQSQKTEATALPTPGLDNLWEQAIANAPEETKMSNGLLAVRGRATFNGFSEDNLTAFVTVNLDSGKKYDLTAEVGKVGIFRSEDLLSHPNQPAPTAENSLAVLESLKDTPVFLRFDPGSLQVWSIIILKRGDQ